MKIKFLIERYLKLDNIENTDTRRKAFILAELIVSMFFILFITFVISGIVTQTFRIRHVYITTILLVASFGFLYLIRIGHPRRSAVLYISFLLLMIFVFSWNAGGLKAHGIKILPIIVLFAGLTLGKREIWYFGLLASLGGLVFVVADYAGVLPVSAPIGSSNLLYWVYSSAGILSLCLLENLSVGLLQTVLNQNEQELSRRVKSEEMLRLNNIQLAEIMRFQSHVIRKSIANVLGIVHLIDFNDPNKSANVELMKHLEDTAKELDETLHKMMQDSDRIYSVSKDEKK